MNQWDLEANTRNRRQTREDAHDYWVAFGFGVASDWLSRWRELYINFVDEILTIQMKAIEQYFHVVLFMMLYKVVLTLKSVDETLVHVWPFKWKLLSSTFVWCCLFLNLTYFFETHSPLDFDLNFSNVLLSSIMFILLSLLSRTHLYKAKV